MIRAVIFDMDGVLLDSEPYWQEAQREAFIKVGVDVTDAMCHETMGLRIDEVVAHWFKRFGWHGLSCKEVEEQVIQGVIDRIHAHGELLPGVGRAVGFFRNKDLRIALASSSAVRLINAVIDKFELRNSFDVIHSAEHEAYGKPHPAIYLSTADRLGVDPTSCLAVEDSFNGLIAAKAARMKTVCIPAKHMWDQTKFDIADVKLRSLNDVTEDIFVRLNS